MVTSIDQLKSAQVQNWSTRVVLLAEVFPLHQFHFYQMDSYQTVQNLHLLDFHQFPL